MDKPDAIILGHQRSGTHLLLTALASHPGIHGRGECLLKYKESFAGADLALDFPEDQRYVLNNKPGFLNIAIVMYSQVALFEKLCGPLSGRIIHLLREPAKVALSMAQKDADRDRYGRAVRAHYRRDEAVPEHAPVSPERMAKFLGWVVAGQRKYAEALRGRPDVLTVSYEELTGDREVRTLAPAVGARLLGFLGLDVRPLATPLRKTGTPEPVAAPSGTAAAG